MCVSEYPTSPHRHEATLAEAAKNCEDLEGLHQFCRGLEWDTNFLAAVYTALDPDKARHLYQVNDQEDFYTSEDGDAYLEHQDFSDNEDEIHEDDMDGHNLDNKQEKDTESATPPADGELMLKRQNSDISRCKSKNWVEGMPRQKQQQ